MRKLTNHRTRCKGSTKRNNNKRIITITINEATITVNNEATAGSDAYVDWTAYTGGSKATQTTQATAPVVTAKPSPPSAPSADLVFADLSAIAAEFDAIEPVEPCIQRPQAPPCYLDTNETAAPNEQEQHDFDEWLLALFSIPSDLRTAIVSQTPRPPRFYQMLFDAEGRNWRAGALWRELNDIDFIMSDYGQP